MGPEQGSNQEDIDFKAPETGRVEQDKKGYPPEIDEARMIQQIEEAGLSPEDRDAALDQVAELREARERYVQTMTAFEEIQKTNDPQGIDQAAREMVQAQREFADMVKARWINFTRMNKTEEN